MRKSTILHISEYLIKFAAIMKRTIIAIFTILISLVSLANNNETISVVTDAFANSKSDIITTYCSDNIDCLVLNKRTLGDKMKCQTELDLFFRNNNIERFKIVHRGTKNKSTFVVSEMKSKKNQFLLHLLIRDQKIEQIKIVNND